MVFVVVILVATVLLFQAPHRPYRGLTIPPPSAVYVEPIPERPASSAR
jgi:hypothetical protein